MTPTAWTICIIAAYITGSLPFGVIIGRLKGVDIRAVGSKNIGATNVGRVLGKPLGILCFFLDLAKGAGPVLAAGCMANLVTTAPADITPTDIWLWLAVAAAAVAGHMASIFLGFRGGKGVATSFGAMVAMWPLLTFPALSALIVWLITLKGFRFVSLASIIAACSLPVWLAIRLLFADDARTAFTHGWPALLITASLAAIVVWRHRANLQRLRTGDEPRIGR